MNQSSAVNRKALFESHCLEHRKALGLGQVQKVMRLTRAAGGVINESRFSDSRSVQNKQWCLNDKHLWIVSHIF